MHRSLLRAALCAVTLTSFAAAAIAHEGGDHKGHDHGKATATTASDGKAGGAAASAKTPPAQAADAAKKDAAVTAIDQQIAAAKVDKKAAGWKTRLPMPKVVKFEAGKQYFARVQTSEGVVRIKFMPDIAPMHVTNFIYLTRLGFYDGIVFHRVIPKFMAQGGCPLGNGMGQPGYGFGGEFSPKARHDRPGLLSMANTGQPNSDGSQFFLTFVATPWLNDKHTVFGEVVEGLDVLKKMEAAGSQSGQTSKRMTMDKVTIEVI
jgi:cyclophilin family peptidyl-prolyl cis-trans isomerase